MNSFFRLQKFTHNKERIFTQSATEIPSLAMKTYGEVSLTLKYQVPASHFSLEDVPSAYVEAKVATLAKK